MFRSALLILTGNSFSSLLLLARNMLVARLIPVADYGIAATFVVAIAVVEMASALGLHQQIVQSKEGDDPHFQSALQGFQVLRGLASGLLMFVIAAPMANFMGIPDVTWAYRVLALVPILNALIHFDIHRLGRQMVFWPMLLTGALPAMASVLVLWPLAHWLGDWRVLLYSIILQSALAVTVSHLVARRPYRINFDRAILKKSFRFGWPLLANAVLLFFVFQGDRVVVGRVMGMVPLAIFSMGVTLTLTPTLVMAKSAQNFFLPLLSRARAGGEATATEFERWARITLQAAMLNGALTALAMAVLAGPLLLLLLGHKYDDLMPLLLPLAGLAAMRVCKSGPSIVALSMGRTGNAMISNLPRVLVLPVVWVVLEHGGSLLHTIWLGTLAEVVGYALALGLMRGPRLWFLILPFAGFVAYLAVLVWIAGLVTAGSLPVWSSGLAAVLLFPLLPLTMAELRAYGLRRLTRRGKLDLEP